MARYELPTVEDLERLGKPHTHAITIYAETSPAPDQRETSFLNAKSAFDTELKRLRETHDMTHGDEQTLRDHWATVADDPVWTRLSRSVAIFIDESGTEVFVLPNALENQSQSGSYFDIGQLVRAVSTGQTAFALTLSSNGWNLWEATPTTRAHELELDGDHPGDAASATNRATIRGRQHTQRLVGDEGKKVLLEAYAKRVHEAVDSELGKLDSAAEYPLYLFATDPLADMFRGLEDKREVIAVPGAPDELRADQIDTAIRDSLDEVNARHNNALVERIGDDVGRGLVAVDLADVARGAVAGAVDTLVYDFNIDILGTLDDTTGEIAYTDDGYDLISRIATVVLDRGGRVIAVRADEISADIWNGTAVASLRFSLSADTATN
ncbi:hypothetical protein GCM10027169_19310 [Gordonia jinhuaensis]|uniref:Uncharacterized protein n=1 Tax=Gordonia jinhuaensis TaxID=1517702 RepID=A0A916TI45_9ACTN|nr:hypothetical protein [Gordonia jinhuaensis]GGB45603.1 hypothetical protein GCM10011489_36290 [Gordonia jinhuaensis]